MVANTSSVSEQHMADELIIERHVLTTFLDLVEHRERHLLSWGIIEGAHTWEELETLASEHLLRFELHEEVEPEDFVQELIDRRMLYEPEEGKIRSRAAEAVRLFASLRRMFSQHRASPGLWRSAPPLVADFRFASQPRRYPARRISVDRFLGELELDKDLHSALSTLLARGQGYQLAGFQVDAIRQILSDLSSGTDRGDVVCAGTGSGKTLAFYLPALSYVAATLTSDRFARAVAIYPRNELLKDQFSETWEEARRLDALLEQRGSRPLVIGAYFGQTPEDRGRLRSGHSWRRAKDGWVCPYFRCPTDGCRGDMIWGADDVRADRHRLSCSVCGATTADDLLALTRKRMRTKPPDVLFATTEILNRSMSDDRAGRVFGMFGAAPPRLVLLDEVHTYAGIHGAQVAYLLRRWRHALGAPVTFVGLSATLRQAPRFFAQLTGVDEKAVTLLQAAEHDMVEEGSEYQLVLRGEPASGVSLVSTTLQTTMLLRRILEPSRDAFCPELFGSKVFLFTDDLDVTNRLYFDLQDAEGLDSFGRPSERAVGPLARLRARGTDRIEREDRAANGQWWGLCEAIGHDLGADGRLNIGRTSSQDVGVARRSDVIVATASLEVGYNDPEVGAVLQHKAPRDAAQFLQRKGRAGRRRSMRPWTVVVLSDHGRDRAAYEQYERLFDPALDERTLPLANRHVLRIQAAYTLMDWVARQPEIKPEGSVWRDFAGPPRVHQAAHAVAGQRRQRAELALIDRLLGDPLVRDDLGAYIGAALGLDPDEVAQLLWLPPRSLLLAMVPTLRRRLDTGWRRIENGQEVPGGDYQVAYQPAPDFVPGSLFSELQLPEVTIEIPPQIRGGDPKRFGMPFRQALSTFAPGSVSFRFTIQHAYAWHWVAPPDPDQSTNQNLDVDPLLIGHADLGTFAWRDELGVAHQVRCLRPWGLRVNQVPRQRIHQSSNSFLVWHTEILPRSLPDAHPPPRGSGWTGLVRDVRFHTHAENRSVEVRRFTTAADADLLATDGTRSTPTVRFVDGHGTPVALGFSGSIDAVCVTVDAEPVSRLAANWANSPAAPGLRRRLFLQRIHDSEALPPSGGFVRTHLAQVYLAALAKQARDDGTGFADAQFAIRAQNLGDLLWRVAQDLYASDMASTTDARRALTDLEGPLRLASVHDALAEAATVLWSNPPPLASHLTVMDILLATLGSAFLNAGLRLCPEFAGGDLTLDLEVGPTRREHLDGVAEVWLTEDTLGGGGIVEELARRFANDPRRFFGLAANALSPGDDELTNVELNRILELATTDTAISEGLEAVRRASGHAPTRQAFAVVRDRLADADVTTSHAVMSALNRRILRPGSSAATDALCRDLLVDWQALEGRWGVEVDVRTWAYLCRFDTRVDVALPQAVPPAGRPSWRADVVQSLFWPMGSGVRSRPLASWNPYTKLPDVEPLILRPWFDRVNPAIPIHATDAVTRIREQLATTGVARATAPVGAGAGLRDAIHEVCMTAVESDFLQVWPVLSSVARSGSELVAEFEIQELAL
jgi:hypothetical protein